MTTESCNGCGASHNEEKCPYCGRFAVNKPNNVDDDAIMKRMRILAGIRCTKQELEKIVDPYIPKIKYVNTGYLR